MVLKRGMDEGGTNLILGLNIKSKIALAPVYDPKLYSKTGPFAFQIQACPDATALLILAVS